MPENQDQVQEEQGAEETAEETVSEVVEEVVEETPMPTEPIAEPAPPIPVAVVTPPASTSDLVRQGNDSIVAMLNSVKETENQIANSRIGIEDAEELLAEAQADGGDAERAHLESLQSAKSAVDKQSERLARVSTRLEGRITDITG